MLIIFASVHIRTFAAESTSYMLQTTFPAQIVDGSISANYVVEEGGIDWKITNIVSDGYRIEPPASGAEATTGGGGTTGGSGGAGGGSDTGGTSGSTSGGGSGSGNPRPSVAQPTRPSPIEPSPSLPSVPKPSAPPILRPSAPVVTQQVDEPTAPVQESATALPAMQPSFEAIAVMPQTTVPARSPAPYVAALLSDQSVRVAAVEGGIAVRLLYIYRATAALEALPAFASAEASLLSLSGATAGMGASGAMLAPLAGLHRRRRHWWGASTSIDA